MQGDVKLLTADVAELKPSIFVAVPRVLERIQGGISGKLKAKPWIVQLLMGLAFKWKVSRIKAGASPARVRTCFCILFVCRNRQYRRSCEMCQGVFSCMFIAVANTAHWPGEELMLQSQAAILELSPCPLHGHNHKLHFDSVAGQLMLAAVLFQVLTGEPFNLQPDSSQMLLIGILLAVQAAPLLDKLLFKPFKAAFGGRVRFIVSGGAPLASHVEDYLQAALCCPVFQVYRPSEQLCRCASHTEARES